jgi:hypothetical protein
VALVILIDLCVLGGLLGIATSNGLEAALPLATFALVFLPIETSIPLGLFEMTTQRLIVATLLVLYISLGRGGDGGRLPLPLKGLILIHIAWCVISTGNSIVPLMSVKKAVSVVAEYYTLYFIYWKTISRKETIQKILFAMVLAMIAASAFGAFEAYGADNILTLLPKVSHHFDLNVDTDREIRVQSTFDHPILFGAALAMAITTALYLLSTVTKRWQKVILWLGIMLMFLNIYKTSSRGPWLDATLGCLLLFIFAGKKVRRPLLIIGMLSVLAMVVRPGIWSTVKGIYDNTFDMNTSTGTSYQYRYALQHAVTNKVLEAPGRTLWGYGLESFYDLQVEGDFLGKPHVFVSCDSAWSEFLVETGFVGLGLMIVFLLRPVCRGFWDYRKLPPPDRYLSLLLCVNLLVFYFQMYSVGMYSWGQNGYMLWIIIALTFAVDKCRSRLNASAPPVEQVTAQEIQPAFQFV